MEPEFYHASIKILQVPHNQSKNEEEPSWLCNPFADSRV